MDFSPWNRAPGQTCRVATQEPHLGGATSLTEPNTGSPVSLRDTVRCRV
jgi:hypothetical protein